MRRRPLAIITLLATTAITLTACGNSPSSTSSATTSGAFPLTVTDVYSKVVIPKAPVRVAALDESYVDAALALEVPVVAYTTYRDVTSSLPDYLGDAVNKYAKDAVNVGTLASPSIEKVVASQPDLIVSAKIRHDKIHSQLTQIAPTYFSQTTGPTWKQNIKELGQLVGKEDKAVALLDAEAARAKKIGDAIKTKLGTNPTLSVVRFTGEQTVRLYTPNSFVGSVFADAGLTMSKASQTTSATSINNDVSQENIATLDADYIFVSDFDQDPNGDAQAKRAEFEQNPLWTQLKGKKTNVRDLTWFTAVGLQGASAILDDLATTFAVPSYK
jgi:iron complex transport system substrate-binding protein